MRCDRLFNGFNPTGKGVKEKGSVRTYEQDWQFGLDRRGGWRIGGRVTKQQGDRLTEEAEFSTPDAGAIVGNVMSARFPLIIESG
jgi:hypothetical protein